MISLFKKCVLISGILVTGICLSGFTLQNPSKTGSMRITGAASNLTEEENLKNHQAYDVEVFYSDFMGGAFNVRYYSLEEKKLAVHTAIQVTTDNYDMAHYTWVNDTTVSIKLYNSVSGIEKKFKVFGNGPRSGMCDDCFEEAKSK